MEEEGGREEFVGETTHMLSSRQPSKAFFQFPSIHLFRFANGTEEVFNGLAPKLWPWKSLSVFV